MALKGTESAGPLAEMVPGAQVLGQRTGLARRGIGDWKRWSHAMYIGTPGGTGAYASEVIVPYGPNGITLVWTIKRIWLRVAVAGGAPSGKWQKSVASGLFVATDIGTVKIVSGQYEGFLVVNATVQSGDKLRWNTTVVGTATDWTVGIELEV